MKRELQSFDELEKGGTKGTMESPPINVERGAVGLVIATGYLHGCGNAEAQRPLLGNAYASLPVMCVASLLYRLVNIRQVLRRLSLPTTVRVHEPCPGTLFSLILHSLISARNTIGFNIHASRRAQARRDHCWVFLSISLIWRWCMVFGKYIIDSVRS